MNTNKKNNAGAKLFDIIMMFKIMMLHSPTYREKYKKFLKTDFPRVPYPKDIFLQLVKLGGEIREIDLLESPLKAFGIEKYIIQYPEDGDNKVSKIKIFSYLYENEVPDENENFNFPDYLSPAYINENQYFAYAPTNDWQFYIGG